MTSRKYPQENKTKEKIRKLFAYRRLTNLLAEGGLAGNQEFVNQLVDVQYQIYMLDAYLESKWEIRKADLDIYWEAIRLSLQQMGYKKKQISTLTAEIEKYQEIERNCRKDKWPTRVSLLKFYTTKSCDVRLMRHLIYTVNPGLKKLWKEDSWIYYDLITEIHDDIADLKEDILTFNGNRFLISILRKGADHTHDAYERFLNKTTEEALTYFETRMDRGQNKQLAGWINSRSKETVKLLNTRINSGIVDQLSKSFLLDHMK